MASNRPFEPFSLASVMQNAEQLKSMKRQSALDDLQAQYLQGQNTRAQSAEGRAQTEFSQEQQVANTRLLNMAAAEVAQNPAAASRWDPIIKAAIPNWEPIQGGDPAQIQAAAKQLFDSTSRALQAFNAGSGVAQAKPSALIEQYDRYVAQGGQLPFVDPNRSGNDFITQFAQSQVGAQYGAPTDVPGVGVVQPSRTQGPGGNVVISPESNVANAEAARAGQAATAKAQAEATAEQQQELTANQRTLEVWGVAKQGLVRALSGTSTGPVQGQLPAVTSGQQIAEGAVAAVAPVLKQLFRSAGEGVFTDRDQQLLLDMVPSRGDHQETIKAKIEMIDAIIQAKLSASIPGDSEAPVSGPPAGVDPALWQYMTPEERALWQ